MSIDIVRQIFVANIIVDIDGLLLQGLAEKVIIKPQIVLLAISRH